MKTDLLVGSTGFVGQNLMRSHKFSKVCHSTDVIEQYGSNPDLCVYAGVPAAMFLANTNPKADLDVIENAFENIIKINPKKLVLISSIAVYDDSKGKDENSESFGEYEYGTPEMREMVNKAWQNLLEKEKSKQK